MAYEWSELSYLEKTGQNVKLLLALEGYPWSEGLKKRLSSTGLIVGRQNRSACSRTRTEHIEQRPCHPCAVEALAALGGGQSEPILAVSANRGDRAAALLPLEVMRRGDREVRQARRLVAIPQTHQTLRFRIRQRTEHDPMDYCEHGGCGADAERQRQDCRNSKTGRAP